MARRLLTLISLASLLLCIATTVLWAWSQWTFTRLAYTRVAEASAPIYQRRLVFLTWRDAAEIMVKTEVFHPDDRAGRERLRRDLPRERHTQIFEQSAWSTTDGGASDAADHWGFWYRSPQASKRRSIEVSATKTVGGLPYTVTTHDERALFFPWWFGVALFGCLPFITVIRHVRASFRVRAGRCRLCGYDLRASLNRCPECGIAIQNKARTLEDRRLDIVVTPRNAIAWIASASHGHY